jgi:4a-hydroxytetrahydrobiopterin dehydratase
MNRLQGAELHTLLASLPAWQHSEERGGTLRREFRFADFAHAFAFMTLLAVHAEKRNHHPEWFNVYNRVDILLTTHDVDGLSMNDIEFARLAEQAAARFEPSA